MFVHYYIVTIWPYMLSVNSLIPSIGHTSSALNRVHEHCPWLWMCWWFMKSSYICSLICPQPFDPNFQWCCFNTFVWLFDWIQSNQMNQSIDFSFLSWMVCSLTCTGSKILQESHSCKESSEVSKVNELYMGSNFKIAQSSKLVLLIMMWMIHSDCRTERKLGLFCRTTGMKKYNNQAWL